MSNVEYSSSFASHVGWQSLNSVFEDTIRATHEVLLRNIWEAWGFSQAFSVVIFFAVPSDVGGMSKWDNYVLIASLFASHHLRILVSAAVIKAKLIASIHHASHAGVYVGKLCLIVGLLHFDSKLYLINN